MLFKKVKDLRIRKKFKKNEISNISLKFFYTHYFNKNKKIKKLGDINNITHIKQKNFSKTKIVRRCIISNRARGSIRPFNVSRIKLRELFQFGIIPGYKKSV